MSHVHDLLAPYCENALPEAEAREVKAHLETCAGCRAAHSDVERGLLWARALEPASLPEEAAARVRGALRAAPTGPSFLPWLGVAAAVVALLGIHRLQLRPVVATGPSPRAAFGGLSFEPDPGEPTRFEETAFDLHQAHVDRHLDLDLRSSSVPEVREWAEDRVGLGVNLAVNRSPDDERRYVVEGVRKVAMAGGATALAVAYAVDGRPATLLTARAADVTDRTPEWGAGGKRVRFRDTGRGKLLAWTNGGQAYALVSNLADYGQEGCLICHTTEVRRQAIRALGHATP
jgi:putative zinc finger protein